MSGISRVAAAGSAWSWRSLRMFPALRFSGTCSTAGCDEHMEMGIVLAEDEQIGGGRAGDVCDCRDEIAGAPGEGGQFRLIEAGEPLSMQGVPAR